MKSNLDKINEQAARNIIDASVNLRMVSKEIDEEVKDIYKKYRKKERKDRLYGILMLIVSAIVLSAAIFLVI